MKKKKKHINLQMYLHELVSILTLNIRYCAFPTS